MRKLVTLTISLFLTATCFCAVAFADTSVETVTCEHSFYEYQKQYLTCEEDGIVERNCWKCGYSDTLTTPATGHTFGEWFYEYSFYEPDCENDGKLIQKCQNTGCYKINEQVVPAIGHAFGEWYYENEWDYPDCEWSGTMIQSCQNEGCNEYNSKSVSALGHNYKTIVKKAKLNQDGYTVKYCTRCEDDLYEDDYEYYGTTIYAPSRIKLSTTNYTYNGKVRKPTVKVYNSAGYRINAKHYTVSYQKGRKNVGKYKVTVTFKKSSNKYTGKMSTSFKINPKPVSISSLTKGKNSFTVKWKKGNKQITGYQIRYSDISDMDWAKYKTIKSTKTTKKKISNLYEDEKYYVQIRTYKVVKGKKFYSSWSKKKTIRTKKNATYSYDDDDDDYYGTIYITRTGECYHTHKCGNGTYYASTLSQALSMGLRACQKCF